MDRLIYVLLLLIASAVFFYGLYLKNKVNNATEEIKSDERFEYYKGRANFITIFGLLIVFSIVAVLFMPNIVAIISFSALVLYLLAYSTHVSMGVPYSRIIRIGIISVAIVIMSVFLLHNFG